MVNCEGSSRNLKLTLESTQTFTEVYLLIGAALFPKYYILQSKRVIWVWSD